MELQALVPGKNPGLSIAEALAFLDKTETEYKVYDVSLYGLIVQSQEDLGKYADLLGGTLKICRIEEKIKKKDLADYPPHGQPGSLHAENTLLSTFKQKWQTKKGGVYSPADLLKKRIREEVVIQGTDKLYIGKTIAVNNPFEQARRDMKKPARIGLTMAPSRAMILVNLSKARDNMLDPFCGSGTIPIEAIVNGVKEVIASDKNKKAVEAALENMKWAKKKYNSETEIKAEVCDARKIHEKFSGIDAIATEPELGPPLTNPVPKKDAETIQKYLHNMYSRFMESAWKALCDNGKVAIVLPAIMSKKGRFIRQRPEFKGFKLADPFKKIPKNQKKRWMHKTIIDEEREPGKKRVVAREFAVFEKKRF